MQRRAEKGHNRWHPDILPAAKAEPGEEVVLQTRNAFDGGIASTSISEDLRNVNLNVVHPLTGPVYVEGAQPGDLLEVNILNIEPASWGFTSIIPGFGFLRDLFLEPYLVHWNISRVCRVCRPSWSAGSRGTLHGNHRRRPIPKAATGHPAARGGATLAGWHGAGSGAGGRRAIL